MGRRWLGAFAGLLVAAVATGAAAEEPVAAPPGARLLLDVAAQGVQIYACEKGSNGYRWVLAAPDAALFDAAGRQIGTHFAGPTWQMDDGSKIVGAVAAKAPGATARDIPWLLLRAKSHEGSGVLSGVGLVRRVDTQGGAAPAATCDAAEAAAPKARMRYTARYLFYAAPQ